MNKLKFSVLMSVYYKENPNYLDKALESIVNQTVMPDEIVLVEDGTLSKKLDEVIEKYSTKYNNIMKVIKYEKNRGLGIALHDGLLECSNEIVFRMDSDDISVNTRFEKQIAIFNNMEVDVVGTNITEYDQSMTVVTGIRSVPENNSDIMKMSKKRNPMNHVTVAYKKSSVLLADNYQNMPYFEDYYLWIKMLSNNCKFYNIQESLVNVRGGNDMIRRRGGIKYIKPIMNFEKAILKLHYINVFQYFKNIIVRIAGSLIPNNLRFLIYRKVLRK